MPLTEGDVLDTLSDPVALGIEFHVDKIHIKGEYLTTVRDHIRAGNILVKGGTQDLAFYDQLARMNIFLSTDEAEQVSVRSSSVSNENLSRSGR